jgi:leader peptidase (prepilin peptidase)/N-methyltransferase
MLPKYPPWKHRVVLIVMGAISILLYLCGFTNLITGLKYLIFFALLLFASYFDLKCRMIPDWIHVLLIIIGLINFDVTKSVLGFLISPLPFLIMALVSTGSIGGGDIKLIGSSGFVLGYGSTIVASMIGIIVAVCFYSLYYLGYKKVKSMAFPFAPFFQLGCMIAMFFGGT